MIKINSIDLTCKFVNKHLKVCEQKNCPPLPCCPVKGQCLKENPNRKKFKNEKSELLAVFQAIV